MGKILQVRNVHDTSEIHKPDSSLRGGSIMQESLKDSNIHSPNSGLAGVRSPIDGFGGYKGGCYTAQHKKP
jgi:hypothetical protein